MYTDGRRNVYVRVQGWIHYFRFRCEHDVHLPYWQIHQSIRWYLHWLFDDMWFRELHIVSVYGDGGHRV